MKPGKLIIPIFISISLLLPGMAYAREGDAGYEGGVSAAQVSYKTTQGKITYNYQEVCFVTGKPVTFKGTLTIAKTLKKGKDGDSITAKYTYDLKNVDSAADTLKRNLEYTTSSVTKSTGQTIETTSFSKAPTETIVINKITYALTNYDFTRTKITDIKPAISYYSGNVSGEKTFQMTPATTTGATASTTMVDVKEEGEFYGYDEYWGNTEVQTLNYVIQSSKQGDPKSSWGGSAAVNVSSTTTKQLKYVENQPDQISFDGGYVQTQHDESTMEYHLKLPAFDSKGIPTDTVLPTDKTLMLDTYPSESRLPVASLDQIRGHWAEEDIRTMFSLEVFKGDEGLFDPDKYITRAEFAAAVAAAAKEVPADPAFASKTSAKTTTSSKAVKSAFRDVQTADTNYSAIDNVTKRGIMSGTLPGLFDPGSYLTNAEITTIFMRALGLENLAPNPAPVTTFRDNDKIPSYARRSVYAANEIGLVQADDKGNFNPNQKLTKAQAAEMLNSFINYMRDGIRKDYKAIINY